MEAKTTQDVNFHLGSTFFEHIVNRALDIVSVIAADGQVVYQAPSVFRVLGYPPEASLGSSVYDVIHPQDLTYAQGVIRSIFDGAMSEAEAELRFLHADGEYRSIHAVAQLLQTEPEPLVVVNARDVTSNLRAHHQLAKSNELLSRVFSVSQNLLSITLPETGEFLDVNDSWCKTIGFSRDDIIGRTETDIGLWGDTENRRAVLDDLTRQGSLTKHPAVLYTRSGDARNVLIDAQFLTVADEPRIVMSCQDITESRLVEEELRQAQKMESLGQLTGGVAHDFNNLLGVTMGNAELLLLVLEDNPRAAGYAQQILDATIRGADLTQQLLAFARRQTLSPEQIDIAALLDKLRPLLQTTVSENTKIVFETEDNLATCLVDPSQLENAILNLTLNARDAMPHGGTVTFTARAVTIPSAGYLNSALGPLSGNALPIVNLPPGEYLKLEVRDTGHGMDEPTRQRAVEPFFTTKEVGKGTGLGLSMVFGFAEQSGGAVSIDSEVGEGTSVCLYFPKSHRNQFGSLSEDLQDFQNDILRSQMTVLIVEDNQPLRDLVDLYLKEAGFNVLQASGEADLHQAMDAADKIDVLISDIVLAGQLSGPELAQRVAQEYPDVRTLFMTGYSRTEPVDGHQVLQKPFSRSEFMQALGQLKLNQG